MSRIAAVQCRVTDLDVRANLARPRRRVGALPDDVALAVLPERYLMGVTPDRRLREVALDREGPTFAAVRTVAADHGVDVLVGYVERTDGNLHDDAAYVTPAATTVCRKRHRWGCERGLLTPGDERIVVGTPSGGVSHLLRPQLRRRERRVCRPARRRPRRRRVAGDSQRRLAVADAGASARRRALGRRYGPDRDTAVDGRTTYDGRSLVDRTAPAHAPPAAESAIRSPISIRRCSNGSARRSGSSPSEIELPWIENTSLGIPKEYYPGGNL